MFDPRQGGLGGASSMYNTPQNLLAEIQDTAKTLSMNPIMFANQTVLSQSEPERIGEMVCGRLLLLGFWV